MLWKESLWTGISLRLQSRLVATMAAGSFLDKLSATIVEKTSSEKFYTHPPSLYKTDQLRMLCIVNTYLVYAFFAWFI